MVIIQTSWSTVLNITELCILKWYVLCVLITMQQSLGESWKIIQFIMWKHAQWAICTGKKPVEVTQFVKKQYNFIPGILWHTKATQLLDCHAFTQAFTQKSLSSTLEIQTYILFGALSLPSCVTTGKFLSTPGLIPHIKPHKMGRWTEVGETAHPGPGTEQASRKWEP